MAKQIEVQHIKCLACTAKIDNGVLVSFRNNDRWSLMLCPKKVKEKLANLGYAPTKVGEVYERFVENFARFPICPQGDAEHKML